MTSKNARDLTSRERVRCASLWQSQDATKRLADSRPTHRGQATTKTNIKTLNRTDLLHDVRLVWSTYDLTFCRTSHQDLPKNTSRYVRLTRWTSVGQTSSENRWEHHHQQVFDTPRNSGKLGRHVRDTRLQERTCRVAPVHRSISPDYLDNRKEMNHSMSSEYLGK